MPTIVISIINTKWAFISMKSLYFQHLVFMSGWNFVLPLSWVTWKRFITFGPEDWPRGYKTFPCSTQLSTKFILLINVQMPTIVGILTFISMINTISQKLKAINFFICRYFSVYEQWNFVLSSVGHEKSFITFKGPKDRFSHNQNLINLTVPE